MNFLLDTDSYKLSHFLGYPRDLEHVYSYGESRGGRYPSTVFFGSRKFVHDLEQVRVTADNVFEAASLAKDHGEPFNEEGAMRIVDKWGGRVPVRIKAVREGTLVPTRNVLITVENIDPALPWLTSFIETPLLRPIWYGTTVATRIHYMREKIKPYYDATSDSLDGLSFGVLDFSARGCTSREAAELGGMAHLLSFVGSDNLPAIMGARRYYNEPMAGFSVPATEHSVTTSYGRDNERDSIGEMIDRMMPENGILSLVGDTWHIYDFIRKAAEFKDRIHNKGGTLVIRPDSGEMRQVLPQVMREVREKFGCTRNAKGYDVLNAVKVLQGDGINENSVTTPFAVAKDMGISADSIMTGSGGGLMQTDIDRDTCKFAFKASNVTRNGVDIPVAKDPITDPGKRSKMGRLALLKGDKEYYTSVVDRFDTPWDCLETIYDPTAGPFEKESFADIRKRLNG